MYAKHTVLLIIIFRYVRMRGNLENADIFGEIYKRCYMQVFKLMIKFEFAFKKKFEFGITREVFVLWIYANKISWFCFHLQSQ